MIFFSSCGYNKNNKDINDKISIEIKHFENQASNILERITKVGDYKVEETEAKVKSDSQSSSEDESSSNSGGDSDKSSENSENITIMKSEYKNNDGTISDEEWKKINEELLKVKTSWTAIEEDLISNSNVSKDILLKITDNIQNLSIFSNDKVKDQFLNELVVLYSNIVVVSESANIEKNELYLMKVKSKLYDSYNSTLNNDWEVSKNKIDLARNYFYEIDQIKESDIDLFDSIIDSIDNKNKGKYIIVYDNIIERLKRYEK